MKPLAPLLLTTLVLLPACGDDESPSPTRKASPGPLASLLDAPPQVADELRLTFALGLKRAIDAEAARLQAGGTTARPSDSRGRSPTWIDGSRPWRLTFAPRWRTPVRGMGS